MFGRNRGAGPSLWDYIGGVVIGDASPNEVKDNWKARQAQELMLRERSRLYGNLRQQDQIVPGRAQQMMGNWSVPPPPDQVVRGAPKTLRDAQADILRAQEYGVETKDLVDLLDKTQPDIRNINGWAVDGRDAGTVGKFFGEAPTKGAEPLLNQRGEHVGWRLMDGTLEAVGKAAEAEAYGKGRGGAPWEMVDVPDPSGAPRKMFKDDARAMGRDGFRGQTPAEASADKVIADAGATAQTELPSALETASFMRGLITQLRDHPGRKMATGISGILPTVPGTPARDFEVLLDQARGTTFLQAYEKLKGSGQITEVEGKKAEQAVARLNRTQSEEGFLKALSDLESVVSAAEMRAKQKAGQGGGGNSMARPLSTSAFSRSAVEAEMRRRGLLQ